MVAQIFTILYSLCGMGTFVYLSFFDGLVFTWWNWPLIFGTSFFLGWDTAYLLDFKPKRYLVVFSRNYECTT
jgi:hypothetical protein